jgi:hypothetical protein
MTTVDVTRRTQLPLEIDLEGIEAADFIEYYLQNRNQIDEKLDSSGAVKFKGVRIESVATFQTIVDAISSKFLSYIDGNSPRTKLSGNVYTSTEYDKSQRITMHNELSYSQKWPRKLFFSCIKPALSGGETLLADSRQILRSMNPEIVELFRKKDIMYIRNLHSGIGIGPSWQDTFETTSKDQLEVYLRNYAIDFEWLQGGALRLKNVKRGFVNHWKTGEEVWFNQVDQFHPIQLGEEIFSMMEAMYASEEDFPMYVKFGDGSVISPEIVSEILETIDQLTVAPVWNTDEFLIVDNELVSHGRNPYVGERKVLVAMSE